MKIRSVYYGSSALILCCLLLSGFIPEPTGGFPACLKVPFIPQLGKNWCWAACTEMISTYYHNEVNPKAPAITQCEEVKQSFGKSCTLPCPPPKTIPKEWDQGGFPFNPDFGYQMSTSSGALSWQTLLAQFAAKKPVIFQWYWTGITKSTVGQGDAHLLVAEGCLRSSYIMAPGWLSIHDPLPVGRGRHRIITYNEYANKRPLTYPGDRRYVFSFHGADLYNITYDGGR